MQLESLQRILQENTLEVPDERRALTDEEVARVVPVECTFEDPQSKSPQSLGLQGATIEVIGWSDTDDGYWLVQLSGERSLIVADRLYLTQGPAGSAASESLESEYLLEMVGDTVASAVCFAAGGLRVVFSSGVHLTIPSEEVDASPWALYSLAE